METLLHTVDGALYAVITYFMLHYQDFTKPDNGGWVGGFYSLTRQSIYMHTHTHSIPTRPFITPPPFPSHTHTYLHPTHTQHTHTQWPSTSSSTPV